jgi:hypothetical protein
LKTGNFGICPDTGFGPLAGGAGVPSSVGVIVSGADWESVNAIRQAKRVKFLRFIFINLVSLEV